LTNCFIAELIIKRRTVMKKPVVDWDLCIGCGSCVELCPEVFELKDEKAYVKGPDKCDTCNCQEAVEICPVEAISWEE
jgi:ferredoxin